jgi:hypothetical protein
MLAIAMAMGMKEFVSMEKVCGHGSVLCWGLGISALVHDGQRVFRLLHSSGQMQRDGRLTCRGPTRFPRFEALGHCPSNRQCFDLATKHNAKSKLHES